MRSFLALVRKDFKGYFDQPTGYILIVVFVALLSWSFFFQSTEVTLGVASLRPLFSVDFFVEQPSIPWLLALFVPAATMRLIAEEQRDGTLELLLTQPVRGWVILLTKFTSGLVFVAIAIGATLSIPLSIQFSGAGNLDWGGHRRPVRGKRIFGRFLRLHRTVYVQPDAQPDRLIHIGALLCSHTYVGWPG